MLAHRKAGSQAADDPLKPPTLGGLRCAASSPHFPLTNRKPAHIARGVLGAALALLATASALSWFGSLLGGLRLAEAAFNGSHVLAALGVGASAHLGWDLLLAGTRSLPGESSTCACHQNRLLALAAAASSPFHSHSHIHTLTAPRPRPLINPTAFAAPLAPISYAWEWGTVVVGPLLILELAGLRPSHIRVKILGALLFASAVLLALLRWVLCGGGGAAFSSRPKQSAI